MRDAAGLGFGHGWGCTCRGFGDVVWSAGGVPYGVVGPTTGLVAALARRRLAMGGDAVYPRPLVAKHFGCVFAP